MLSLAKKSISVFFVRNFHVLHSNSICFGFLSDLAYFFLYVLHSPLFKILGKFSNNTFLEKKMPALRGWRRFFKEKKLDLLFFLLLNTSEYSQCRFFGYFKVFIQTQFVVINSKHFCFVERNILNILYCIHYKKIEKKREKAKTRAFEKL